MNKLPHDWFYNGNLDVEYKKYVFLAYLQYVQRHFTESKLYPFLGELVSHFRSLSEYSDSASKLESLFPKEMVGIDIQKLRLVYRQVVDEGDVLSKIDQIVRFSMQLLKEQMENGNMLYDCIEKHIAITPVGIVPMRNEEGYLILASEKSDYLVYAFRKSIITSPNEKWLDIQTSFIESYRRNLINTFVSIKNGLIKTFRHLPNPAIFAIESDIKIPVEETLLPIGKRMLMRKLEF